MRTAILSVILLLPATLQAQNTRRIEPAQSASHSNPVLSKQNFEPGKRLRRINLWTRSVLKTSPVGSFPPNQFGLYDM